MPHSKPLYIYQYPREDNETSAKYERRMFSAMVSGVDIAIGQIVDQLKQDGLYEDSIILFSSDVSLLIMQYYK